MSGKYTLPERSELVANIRAVYYSATDRQIVDGANWYSDANALAQSLSDSSGYSVEITSAVIAALSPNTGWGQNSRLAIRMVESRGTLNSGGFPDNLRKARAVIASGDMGEISGILFGKNANKVLNFWVGIVSNGREGVCIDRHAFCLAINERRDVPTLTPGRYAALVAAYTDAAIGTPFTPAQIQAITWVTWRNRFWSDGAFDGK